MRRTASVPALAGMMLCLGFGSLAIHAQAGQIELQEPETRQLFAYLEKVIREIAAP